MSRARLIAMLACALALTGCFGPTVNGAAGDTAAGDQLRVQLAQFRSDVAERRLQLRVINDGEDEVVIRSATLESDRLASPAHWSRGDSRVPGGAARDLPVTLPAPNCDAPDAVATVILELDSPDPVSLEVTPTDELGVLESVLAQDCLEQAVAELVTVTPGDALRSELRDGRLVGLLEFRVEPTGTDSTVGVSGEPMLLRAVQSTVMLQPAAGGSAWVLDTPVTEPVVVTLDIVPARCDPHVVAEDKVGTLFPVEIDAGHEASGTITVPVSEAVRGELYDFVAAHCGWPEGS